MALQVHYDRWAPNLQGTHAEPYHRFKNEMVHHDQPVTLWDLHKLVQAINYHYWERKLKSRNHT